MERASGDYDPQWQEKYRDYIASAQEALTRIKPGNRVFVGTGCAQPDALIKAMVQRWKSLEDTEVIHLLTIGDAPYATKELARNFRVNSFFIADNVRSIIQEGLGDYTPVFLSDIPKLFSSGRLPLDAALIQVTPPDKRGMCSFGVSVDIVKAAAENASVVIAQVNPQMPRTLGDSFINIYDIDVLIPVDEPILEYEHAKSGPEVREIAQNVAGLIDNGSTIELGIGRIPHAIVEFLKEKKELGIHTEMLTDAIIDLVDSGVITGERKSLDRGKIVTSFCMGTKKLYDYIHNNDKFSFRPTEYVNDPFIISRQNKMVAINVALEVDLTGQVCADSLGFTFFSGIGGQVDFNRGAARSAGGKAIIAMPSTAGKGKLSRIVPQLTSGAGVVTTRGDVHYVVTEFGIAYLHGKSVQERALSLISIAHPSFREDLLKKAIEAKYLREELAPMGEKIITVPPELQTSFLLDDGTLLSFRPIHPTDEPGMRDLFYELSQQTLYYRFMSRMKYVPRKQIMDFTYIDYRDEIAIVGTLPEAYGEEIISIARYYLDKKTNRAEVAFVVRDEWQNRGIGTFMCRYLAQLAKRNGIKGFTAEVLRENKSMQAVFSKSSLKINTKPRENVISFVMDF